MEKYRFISIDSVISRFYRDARGNDLSETDLIEWTGDALDFMKIPSASEEALAFLEVRDNHTMIPNRTHYIIQVARDLSWSEDNCLCPAEVLVNSEPEECIPEILDCNGQPIPREHLSSRSPYFEIQYNYDKWNNNVPFGQRFAPVRLANHTLFNTLVCKEVDSCHGRGTGEDEYTIIGDRIRFSFREGMVAIPYIRQKMDSQTGLPMIPDDAYAKAAINYYLIWKMKERECWMHREGSCQLAERAQIQWNSYIGKFKSHAKMPTGIDEHQNLMEQSMYLIPRLKRYYGFFGKLGTPESRPFNQPRESYVTGYGQRIDAATGTALNTRNNGNWDNGE